MWKIWSISKRQSKAKKKKKKKKRECNEDSFNCKHQEILLPIPFLKPLTGKGRQASLAPSIVADIVTHLSSPTTIPRPVCQAGTGYCKKTQGNTWLVTNRKQHLLYCFVLFFYCKHFVSIHRTHINISWFYAINNSNNCSLWMRSIILQLQHCHISKRLEAWNRGSSVKKLRSSIPWL